MLRSRFNLIEKTRLYLKDMPDLTLLPCKPVESNVWNSCTGFVSDPAHNRQHQSQAYSSVVFNVCMLLPILGFTLSASAVTIVSVETSRAMRNTTDFATLGCTRCSSSSSVLCERRRLNRPERSTYSAAEYTFALIGPNDLTLTPTPANVSLLNIYVRKYQS